MKKKWFHPLQKEAAKRLGLKYKDVQQVESTYLVIGKFRVIEGFTIYRNNTFPILIESHLFRSTENILFFELKYA